MVQVIKESLKGIVQRVTYHNHDNGWTVLKVQPFNTMEQQTVTVHQTKVFAGATMEFVGAWVHHPKYGKQFKAEQATERKPASAAALEKYLGSGLIKGVGPKTAKKIVKHFGGDTLAVFEHAIDRLMEIEGIAKRKLAAIKDAWSEHCAIREVMMFLQGHGISTLFAVRIYKKYGDKAIERVVEDPYCLANDFYGIGFFSADKVALSIGLALDSPKRLKAAIKHVLAASREHGHCYLTESQIKIQVAELLEREFDDAIPALLQEMEQAQWLCVRVLPGSECTDEPCYYSKTLYYDEQYVAEKLLQCRGQVEVDQQRVSQWIDRYCAAKKTTLSDEQLNAVKIIALQSFSVLTGGPGCGKTTTIVVLVRLLEAMRRRVLLVAPTGRAAQRMSEVIGNEAKTIHRLLEWKGGAFQKNEEQPLSADFIIVDECSMLDISLTASLLKAVPKRCQLLLIGDADQLPAVGAGNVLADVIASQALPVFRLTKVFRQAQSSKIIQFAHQINQGQLPRIDSPFQEPKAWSNGTDCMFIDSNEMTQDQSRFVAKVKRHLDHVQEPAGDSESKHTVSYELADDHQSTELKLRESALEPYQFRTDIDIQSYADDEIVIPKAYQHVDLEQVVKVETQAKQLRLLMKKVHPWSSLNYGLSASDTLIKLYLEWIPKYYGADIEIQVLSPMTRGTLGTYNLNRLIQQEANPAREGKSQLIMGERIFREGDRVIHRKNNYDLNVFNGDIGKILSIDNESVSAVVSFYPDHREVVYQSEDLVELELAYAITIHKSQGSEFKVVIIPVLSQHFKMLYRNLVYTGLTRAKQLAIFIGTRQALAMAIRQQDAGLRQTALQSLLSEDL